MPTVSAKPSVLTTENNVSPWSTTLKAFIPLNDGAGPPREVVTNGLCMGVGSSVGSTRVTPFLRQPVWVPNGFPYVAGGDKTLRFFPFSRAIQGPFGSGFTAASPPAQKAIICTFKVDYPPFAANQIVTLASNGLANSEASLTLTPYSFASNQGAGAYKLSAFSNGNAAPTNDLIVYPGVWYTACWSHDNNGGAPNIKMDWYLYDWSTGTTYEDHQTGSSITYYCSSSTQTFSLNGNTSGGNASTGFVGHIYNALLDTQAWTLTMFNNFVADPSAPIRGTAYTSSSGTFTAGKAFVGPCTATTISLNATRPSGGVTPYSGQWYRQLATAGAFTPGPGNAIPGATSPAYVDTPPSQGPWLYKYVYTDSSGTPQTITALNPASSVAAATQIEAATWKRGGLAVLGVGDSITDNQRDKPGINLTALSGTEISWYNIGVQGGLASDGGGLSVGPGTYALGTHGTPTGGTFTLTWNGNTTAAIAYNATASAIQTALAALPGWSGVTVTNGPLPTYCVITLPSALMASTNDLTIGVNSLTNAGGSPPAPWIRSQARLGAAMLAADPSATKLVRIHLGANDSGSITPAAMLTIITNYVTFFNARVFKVALHFGVPRSDSSELQAQNLAAYNANYPTIVATVNDASKCVLGDTSLYNLASLYYSLPYFDSGRIHPASLYFQEIQAAVQSFADATALGVISAGGTYTAAANVRSGTDRGDGVTGTLVVPAAATVLIGTTYDNGTAGTVTQPATGDVRSGTTYGAGGNQFTGTLDVGGGGSYPTADEIAEAVVSRPEFIDIWAEAAGDATGLDAASKTFMIPGTNTPRLNASMSGGGRAVSRA